MKLIDRYIDTDFTSYEDFIKRYKLNIPENFNFAYDIADEYARLCPEKLALMWCNETGDEKSLTFGDMKRFSDKTANLLLSIGIKKGDAVMTILKRRHEYWPFALAAHKIGAVIIPATHLLTQKDIEYRCQMANIRMILAVNDDEVLGHIDAAKPDCPGLEFLYTLGPRSGWRDYTAEQAAASDDFVRPCGDAATHNEDPMLMYFTSGTTGMPKMVLHNFIYPLGHIINAAFWHCTGENSLHITVADTGWAKASWGKIYGEWIAGSAQFVYDFDKFNPAKLLEAISSHHVTSFCAPPTIYRFIIKEDMTGYDLSSLEYATTAGEPLNPEVVRQFRKATGITIHEAFGQTETTPLCATFKWCDVREGSMGLPSPGYDIVLADDDGNPVDLGEEGQIAVNLKNGRPAGLFMCYFKNEEATNESFRNGLYYTGDIAWQDEDGYFWYKGRADDVIKSSGYRIGPFEVESALLEHPAVLECAITGVPDPVRGQIIKATVVLARGYTPSDELTRELQNHVKKTTAPYKYPRVIEYVDELPKTIGGKIKRKLIRTIDEQKAK